MSSFQSFNDSKWLEDFKIYLNKRIMLLQFSMKRIFGTQCSKWSTLQQNKQQPHHGYRFSPLNFHDLLVKITKHLYYQKKMLQLTTCIWIGKGKMPLLPMTLLVRKPDSTTSASEFNNVRLVCDVGMLTAV